MNANSENKARVFSLCSLSLSLSLLSCVRVDLYTLAGYKSNVNLPETMLTVGTTNLTLCVFCAVLSYESGDLEESSRCEVGQPGILVLDCVGCGMDMSLCG